MNRLLTVFTVLLGLTAVAFLYQPRARADAGSSIKIGAPAPDFTLPNVNSADNQAITLSSLKGKIVVISFDSKNCPVARAYHQRFNDFYSTTVQTADAKPPVLFLAINSNENEQAGDIKNAADGYGAKYPILKDAGSKVADLYGAMCTPHVFIVDSQGNLRYIGAFDDAQRVSKVSQHYVADAVAALQAGKDPSTPQTEPFGCAIHRP
jgi:peroxiredoxin